MRKLQPKATRRPSCMRIQVIALTPDGYMPNAEVPVILTVFVAAPFPTVRLSLNVELNEDMEFACTPSVPLSGARRPSSFGRHGVGGLQIPSRTSFGESRAAAPTRSPASLRQATEIDPG